MINYIKYKYYTCLQYMVLILHIIRNFYKIKYCKVVIIWFYNFRKDLSKCETYDQARDYINAYKEENEKSNIRLD